ncbi:uncharacterized protein OCT59_005784 [Rhizophagus irregularis]|uniref:uncharacterized protein n=1 Tax=Rhizophagus irregularis TaxID=588596 RepID=UPI0033286290|nr:hypothetical protein OCT59_005784 [Rhizophagus irregularis]
MDEIKLSDDVFEQIKDFKHSKGGFGTTFKAVWKDGPWGLTSKNKKLHLERIGKTKVALKCLHNSQDITADFLKKLN